MIYFCFVKYIFIRNLFKDFLTYYNSMNKNININEDIYNKFYSTLLFEIKKMIKKFQWRKASRKYKQNNLEKYSESNKKYYYNTPGLREKILNFRKLKYKLDENYRNKKSMYQLNYYQQHKDKILIKVKERYQLTKNEAINNLEINNNVIPSH